MSTQTLTPSTALAPDVRLTFGRVLRSEWVKLTSLRSTVWSLALIVVFGIGLSLVMASTFAFSMLDGQSSAQITVMISTIGLFFGQLIAAILGVLVISGEYSTGMIRSTFAAVPNRLPVLAAKAITLFVLVTATGAVTMFGAWAATFPLLDGQGLAAGLGTDGVALALGGGALLLGLTAVFALGLGALLRVAAGGIAAALGVILVIPMVTPLLALAAPWVADIDPYLFASAGSAMAGLPIEPAVADPLRGAPLQPWAGGLVVTAWSLVSLALGSVAASRRNV